MNAHADKTQKNKYQSVANAVSKKQSSGESVFQFVDNRPEAITQKKLQEIANNSSEVRQLRAIQEMANNSPKSEQATQLQTMAVNHSPQQQPIQKKKNNKGLPDYLKSGTENFSGYSMDDVRVHYSSDKPAQLQAHAYAQGTEIHLASGQEKHLPHEAWHVAQQKQGRVKPTKQMNGKVCINDDSSLEREADVMGAKGALFQLVTNAEIKNQKQSGFVSNAVAQLLKLNAGLDNEVVVNIGDLSLERIYNYLGRTADPIVTFEEGDMEALKTRANALLPGAFTAIRNAQASDGDLAVLAQRNVHVSGADQQMLLDFMKALSDDGSLTGLDSWLASVSAQGADSRQDHMNELWEAARQFFFHGVRNIDLSEQGIPGTNQTADLTAGNLQVEVKTVRAPISRATDLDHQLTSGLAKFANVPPGRHYEVSLYVSFNVQLLSPAGMVNGVVSRTVNPATLTQTKTISPPPDKKTGLQNPQIVQDEYDYPTALVYSLNHSNWPGADKVTRVNVIMENSRSYYAVRTDDGWIGGLM
jgi:hypothetical protein